MNKVSNIQVLSITTGFALAHAALLRLLGRSWWCKCGSLNPFAWDIWSVHNSQHLIDPYTPSHFLHGVILFGVLNRTRLPLRIALILCLTLEVGWELLENSDFIINRYREGTIALEYFGDSILNSVSDIAVCALGFLFTSRVRRYASVLTFIGLEILTTLLVRDGLLLNVLMLVKPLESVKAWQMGG